MSRVFVPQEPMWRSPATGNVVPKHDITPASQYGELVYLLSWSEPHRLTPDEMQRRLEAALADFRDEDYILLIGNPAAMSMAVTLAVEANDGYCQMLLWNNKPNKLRYDVTCINLRIGESDEQQHGSQRGHLSSQSRLAATAGTQSHRVARG